MWLVAFAGNCLLRPLLACGQTPNTDLYCQQLDRLKEAIGHKRSDLANRRRVIFNEDNVRPNTWIVTRQKPRELGWEIYMHPPYGPDPAPVPGCGELFYCWKTISVFCQKGRQFLWEWSYEVTFIKINKNCEVRLWHGFIRRCCRIKCFGTLAESFYMDYLLYISHTA